MGFAALGALAAALLLTFDDAVAEEEQLPVEDSVLTFAPHVPPPITRKHPVRLRVQMTSSVKELLIDQMNTYECWTFGGNVPGPFIRAREGDVLDMCFTNNDTSGMPHNIDLHAVTGPGGGTAVLTAESLQTKKASFRLLTPGLYIYHCAVEPIGVHIANGMYGLVLVEPASGMQHADKEFYVMQSEFYTRRSPGESPSPSLELDYEAALMEQPTHVVFNGRTGALTDAGALRAQVGDTVRIFFGNIGPSLFSAFHVIGTTFDRCYRDADLISPPARNLQTTTVPPGGATVVEFKLLVPGSYTLMDHSSMRVEKGAVGFLLAEGQPASPDIYVSDEPPTNCAGCKIHP